MVPVAVTRSPPYRFNRRVHDDPKRLGNSIFLCVTLEFQSRDQRLRAGTHGLSDVLFASLRLAWRAAGIALQFGMGNAQVQARSRPNPEGSLKVSTYSTVFVISNHIALSCRMCTSPRRPWTSDFGHCRPGEINQ